MRGRPFAVAWREPDTPEALKEAYQRERDSEVRTRLHSLWLLRCGWRLGMLAEVRGAHYRSVQRWVGWYRKGGLPEVRRHKMGGRGPQPWLSNYLKTLNRHQRRYQIRVHANCNSAR